MVDGRNGMMGGEEGDYPRRRLHILSNYAQRISGSGIDDLESERGRSTGSSWRRSVGSVPHGCWDYSLGCAVSGRILSNPAFMAELVGGVELCLAVSAQLFRGRGRQIRAL